MAMLLQIVCLALLSLLQLLVIIKYVACDYTFSSPKSLQRVLLPPAYLSLYYQGMFEVGR